MQGWSAAWQLLNAGGGFGRINRLQAKAVDCVEGAPVPVWLSAACRVEQLLHASQHHGTGPRWLGIAWRSRRGLGWSARLV